jgi:hypothetical protein
VFVVLLVPAIAAGQGIKVTSSFGPVEVIPAGGADLIPADFGSDAVPLLDPGDEIRTGPGGQVTLELPDGSYIVVSENTTLEIEHYWGSEVRNLMRVMLGRVRFYIQRLGGRPNPYQVNTPTALIAVRGTEFDVRVDQASSTEVRTYEGRVTVAADSREVILDAGFKTRVRQGQRPLTPVGLDEDFEASRTVQIVRTSQPDPGRTASATVSGVIPIGFDNDRRNRPVGPLSNPGLDPSGSTVRRGKLSFPQ